MLVLLNALVRIRNALLAYLRAFYCIVFTGKLREGKLVARSFVHFDELCTHLQAIHAAQTPEMLSLLTKLVGKVWDAWIADVSIPKPQREGLCALWNEYHKAPWNCYSLGSALQFVPAVLPANQCIESWHKTIMGRLKGRLRASTSNVLQYSLPLLLTMDGINMPKQLSFQADAAPRKMLVRALQMLKKKDDILFKRDGFVYVLSSHSSFKKISSDLVFRYALWSIQVHNETLLSALHSIIASIYVSCVFCVSWVSGLCIIQHLRCIRMVLYMYHVYYTHICKYYCNIVVLHAFTCLIYVFTYIAEVFMIIM